MVLFGGYENGRPPFTRELRNEIHSAEKSFIRRNTSHCARRPLLGGAGLGSGLLGLGVPF